MEKVVNLAHHIMSNALSESILKLIFRSKYLYLLNLISF